MDGSIKGGKANEVKQKDGGERMDGRRDGGRQQGCRTTGARRGREAGGSGGAESERMKCSFGTRIVQVLEMYELFYYVTWQ